MAKNYSAGRFAAYGQGRGGELIGYVEDGTIYSSTKTWEFRIDGNEIYGIGGDFVGTIDDTGEATRVNGQFLFRLIPD